MTPVKRSIFSESFIRRISLTLASVPAFSSALNVSIFRLPSRPPWALISSAARMCPLYEGSPSTAAAPVKKVMWPILYGVSGMLPLGCACACEISGTAARGTPAAAAAPAAAVPTVTPRRARKSRRLTSCVMGAPSSLERPVRDSRAGAGRIIRRHTARSHRAHRKRSRAAAIIGPGAGHERRSRRVADGNRPGAARPAVALRRRWPPRSSSWTSWCRSSSSRSPASPSTTSPSTPGSANLPGLPGLRARARSPSGWPGPGTWRSSGSRPTASSASTGASR